MNVSEKELHTKLRRMRSLLKFEPHIDVHHRSFLDFLNEPSRSGEYHVSKRAGTMRYVELVVDSIVRYVSMVTQNPNHHKTHHLNLKFKEVIQDPEFLSVPDDLPIEELRDVSRPLVQIQDQILKLPDFRLANNLLTCDKCPVFNVIRPLLLHFAIHRCIDAAPDEVKVPVTKGNRTGDVPSFKPEAMQNPLGNDLDSSLSSLLTHLQETKPGLLPSTTIINHTYSILGFDCAETAVKVRSMSDAQRLVDFLVYKSILGQYNSDGMSKAARLVLNIFLWVPILPRLLLLNMKRITHNETLTFAYVQDTCQSVLMWRVLDQNYVHLAIKLQGASLATECLQNTLRQALPLNFITVIEIMLDVARAIQYLHSMNFVPNTTSMQDYVYLDLSLRPKIRIAPQFLYFINTCTRPTSEYRDAFNFGYFFYEVLFDMELYRYKSMEERRRIVVNRPSKPEIPEFAWQLIQRCCAEDPTNRLTIDEVVKEMETWGS
ncbi:hypothetical protein JOM56_002729 [Amanita muscaria]